MTFRVDIPVMSGGEATFVTVDSDTDDPALVYNAVVIRGSGYINIGAGRLKIRTHLLTPREYYPEPPAWDGLTFYEEEDHYAATATLDGLVVTVADDDGCMDPGYGFTVPWPDVIAAMRKIGVRP